MASLSTQPILLDATMKVAPIAYRRGQQAELCIDNLSANKLFVTAEQLHAMFVLLGAIDVALGWIAIWTSLEGGTLAVEVMFVFCWLGIRVWVSRVSRMVRVLVVEEWVATCTTI